MSRKLFTLCSTIAGAVGTIASAIVTYAQPEYATAIVAAIGIGSTAIIEICNLFTKEEVSTR